MDSLLAKIKKCTVCLPSLAHGVNPVIAASSKSKIVIIGQAPGSIVHQTGIAWNDKSGDRLRDWLNVSEKEFYNPDLFAIVPMGFCYPGKGKSGDLPPRPECAPKWHHQILKQLTQKSLTLLIGSYAQHYYLKQAAQPTLTQTIKQFKSYLPNYIPLPHPSPRNNIWLAKNPWFEEKVIPELRNRIKALI